MSQAGLYVRIFAALLFAILPIVLGVVTAVAFDPPWLSGLADGPLIVVLVIAALVWAGILAVLYSRSLLLDLRSIVRVAERGRYEYPDRAAGDAPTVLAGEHQRMAAALDERNRQMRVLAEKVRTVPITDDARTVVAHVVETARMVTGDPTWTLVVLDDEVPHTLLPGSYPPELAGGGPSPLVDLHQWAAVAGEPIGEPARRIDGPWGAFVVVDVAVSDRLRALFLAPWEGRPGPSPAELTLFALLGQHAATAIDHALLYAQLREQTDELNRMAAIQTDFLRGVSHDLQTPLTSISALASELRALAEHENRDGTAQDLTMIQHQADRLRRMVGQLLVVSRLEAGAIVPRSELFRPEPLVRRTWEALRPTDRDLIVRVAGDDHLAVGDPDRFEQVLWAVLDNAVKYGLPRSAVSVSIAPAEPAADAPQCIEVTVADQGIGMDQEALHRATQQFYRSPEARNLVPDGSGIGLYAAKGLIEAMGGTLELESSRGEGTTVRISLPAEPTAGGTAG